MKIAEVTTNEQIVKPLTPDQARVRSIKQNINKQKIALAQERESQQNAKYQKKIAQLKNNTSG
jgi:hypothetical protein